MSSFLYQFRKVILYSINCIFLSFSIYLSFFSLFSPLISISLKLSICYKRYANIRRNRSCSLPIQIHRNLFVVCFASYDHTKIYNDLNMNDNIHKQRNIKLIRFSTPKKYVLHGKTDRATDKVTFIRVMSNRVYIISLVRRIVYL